MTGRWDEDERAALVALLRARPGRLTWSQIVAEVDARGSAVSLWEEHHQADLFGGGTGAADLRAAREDIAAWRCADIGFQTFLDEGYPAQLREVRDLPPVLFHRGDLVHGETAISVVGSRRATEHGCRLARSIAGGLVDRGVTVLAGLAAGIDTAAHTAALENGGRTVAVLGTGIRRSYPDSNRVLQQQIADAGLLLSQFWPDAPPTKQTFPMRNAVMSGFGRATIVVEAGEQSGARIQARRAVEHGRPVVLTSGVVRSNRWAQNMLDRPGVHVASTEGDVMAIVDDIISGSTDLLSLLGVPAER